MTTMRLKIGTVLVVPLFQISFKFGIFDGVWNNSNNIITIYCAIFG